MLGSIHIYWQPIVEILILAVGIYYGFSYVRGTRGASIVVGFLVVMLTLSFTTSFFNLTVLKWLLGNITTFFVVAVIVIFQPEIRRLLAQVGNLQLFATAREQRENIEVVVQTTERLSEVRIGAIIAIEQTTPLRGMVESGVTVDCVATPEMLETIFFPNNAIHDGGVIIKDDRIAYAACIFPLTRRQDLNKSLGTRHRAAIGLSEETDAIVVVVSEETGAISHAYKGQLSRGVTAEDLRAFLSAVLVTSDRPRSLREWLRGHVPWAARGSSPPANAAGQASPASPASPANAVKPAAPPVFRTGTDY